MERIYHANESILIDSKQLHQQTAYHEAGHAAAVYFANRQKKLPPVYFEIRVKKPKPNQGHFFAQVIGGQLIQSLELATIDKDNRSELDDYKTAYEADVMNLLVGPLAEAKFVAERDDEVFNRNLITPHALHNYGGIGDLNKAKMYLNHFIDSKHEQEIKIRELLNQAHEFIKRPMYWKAVKQLADYILAHDEITICCEEIIEIFEHSQTATNVMSQQLRSSFGINIH